MVVAVLPPYVAALLVVTDICAISPGSAAVSALLTRVTTSAVSSIPLRGVRFWLCLVALPNQVVAAVPAARTGSATAVNTLVRNAGGALGGQLAATIIVSSAQSGTGAPAASGYVGALILCAAATCAGAFVACATPRENRR